MGRPHDRLSRTVSLLAVTTGAVAATLVATETPAAAALPVGPPALSGGVNGQVYATVVVGDTVYVGGNFSLAQARGQASTSRDNLAAFDLNTGALRRSWRADVSGTVRSLAAAGDYLYVGGAYQTIGGVSQGRLARVRLSNGAVDDGFQPRVNDQVQALAVGGGAVYAGGQFTTAGGTPQRFLAKFRSTTGAKVTGFGGSASAMVDALALSPDGSRLAVGGEFSTLSGAARSGLGLVSPTSGNAVGPTFAGSVRPMLTVSWSGDGSALFGGSGNSNNLAARWNPGTGALGWHFSVGGDVQAIDFYNGDVYVGFHDNYQGNTAIKLLGVNASSGAISGSFRPTFNQFFGVRTISAGPWGLVVGGQFTTVSGVWAHNVASWPPSPLPVPAMSVDSPDRTPYGSRVKVHVTVAHSAGSVSLSGAGPTLVQRLAQGSTTFSLPRSLAVGAHTLTIGYSGDLRHAARTTTRSLTVTKAGTTVRTTVIRKPTAHRAGKVKVTVSSKVHGAPAPTGIVKLNLTRGSQHHPVKPEKLHSGTATLTLPHLTAGTWRLVATYTGDPNHRPATHITKIKVARGH
jgi:hypothetical protein